MRRPPITRWSAAARRRLPSSNETAPGTMPETVPETMPASVPEPGSSPELSAPGLPPESQAATAGGRWRSVRRPPAVLVVVALLAAGTLGADLLPSGPAARLYTGVGRTAPVVGSVAVCPEASTTAVITTRITAGAGGAGSVRIGAAALAPGVTEKVVIENGARTGEFVAPGTVPVAVVATASGEQHGGLGVEQVTRAETGPQHGLASVRCEPAVADSWYVGAATTISDRSELVLVNPYDDAATIDVELYTRKGRLDPPGTTGISVKPRARVVRVIADWVQDEAWIAVHVVVRSGRVSPAVRRSRSVRGVASGVDWIPRSAAPAEVTSVGALPGGTGERTLLIVNPGLDALTAQVQVTMQDGQFRPIEFADIEVPGQRVVAVPLTSELAGKSAMLTVETDGPLAIAGAYAEYTDPSIPGADFVLAAGMPALSGPAMLTDNRIGAKVDTALMFSAPEGAAEITLTEVLPPGVNTAPRTQLVPVKQGALVVVALSRAFGRGDPLPIVVSASANSGAVYGTRVTVEKSARGPLVTALSIAGQPSGGVPLPEVVHDPAAWLMTEDR